MKVHAIDLPTGKYTQPYSIHKKVLLLALSLIVLTSIPLYVSNSSTSPLLSPSTKTSTTSGLESIEEKEGEQCHIFSGNWVPYPDGPAYYTNETCKWIIPQHNCMKFGRQDSEFMKWRWKPDRCELPLFDAAEFLEIVRGKSLAFLGDSVGRNQMQSLLCLLGNVSIQLLILDCSHKKITHFSLYFPTQLHFTILLCLVSLVIWSSFVSH